MKKDTQKTKIEVFRGPYAFLSNFYERYIRFNGLTYTNAESAFQAQKTVSQEERIAFTTMSASAAKKFGRSVRLRKDWENVKIDIMTQVIRAKFEDPELAAKLLATGDAELIEGNTWNDRFWGADLRTGEGRNELGRILMLHRKELRSAVESAKGIYCGRRWW